MAKAMIGTCGNRRSSIRTPSLNSTLKFTLRNRSNVCNLWKLTEFNSDSRFELDARIDIKLVNLV
ncbi:hypothetical protein Taro_050996 [Colocasia esculenta]|uniref:Uncharacterized protein n=1 Tax=Colocasia esculenta TaxID=4460 RepID=A0A843XFG9_COLES|nr:hypothetical protein [Colocasia esculenta]